MIDDKEMLDALDKIEEAIPPAEQDRKRSIAELCQMYNISKP